MEKSLKQCARHLRRNMTDAEVKLWKLLRNRQINKLKFRRQFVIGSYIVDFVCLEKKLVIEVDGGQHADNLQYDENRTNCLNHCGFRVIRFWNHEVLNDIEAVMAQILCELSPSP